MLRTRQPPRETARMAKDQKIRLGIIFGGRSGEHEVSITSAASVINALDPEEFEITVFGITKTGTLANTSEMRAMLPPDVQSRVHLSPALVADGSGMRVSTTLPAEGRDSRRHPEIIFPLLHGPYGEDGTIQGFARNRGTAVYRLWRPCLCCRHGQRYNEEAFFAGAASGCALPNRFHARSGKKHGISEAADGRRIRLSHVFKAGQSGFVGGHMQNSFRIANLRMR